jgi:outer membrane biosynthesis protein TonB
MGVRLKVEVACLAVTLVIVACGARESTISTPEPTTEPVAVSAAAVDSPSPTPTPTRVPIGVIEENRAGLVPEKKELPPGFTPPEIVEMPELDWNLEPGATFKYSIVVYEFTVGFDGKAKEIECRRESQIPALDAACLNSIKGATFKPAMENGKPIEVKYAVTCRPHPLY